MMTSNDDTITKIERLKELVRAYSEACPCHGDQYGSPGLCDLCMKASYEMRRINND